MANPNFVHICQMQNLILAKAYEDAGCDIPYNKERVLNILHNNPISVAIKANETQFYADFASRWTDFLDYKPVHDNLELRKKFAEFMADYEVIWNEQYPYLKTFIWILNTFLNPRTKIINREKVQEAAKLLKLPENVIQFLIAENYTENYYFLLTESPKLFKTLDYSPERKYIMTINRTRTELYNAMDIKIIEKNPEELTHDYYDVYKIYGRKAMVERLTELDFVKEIWAIDRNRKQISRGTGHGTKYMILLHSISAKEEYENVYSFIKQMGIEVHYNNSMTIIIDLKEHPQALLEKILDLKEVSGIAKID